MSRGADIGHPSRARVFGDRILNGMLGRAGYRLSRITPSPDHLRRARLLATLDVSLVLDVGANAGQYASHLRACGYEGRIVSFEPVSEVFASLAEACEGDPGWTCRHGAVGSADGTAVINVAGNAAASSSLLNMHERHVESAPDSRYVGTETIPVSRLDTLWDELTEPGDRIYLKLDVQGYEMEALRGAEASLPTVAGVQTELSLVPLYEGAPDFHSMISYLEERGFRLGGLEAGHDDVVTGEMLQADGIFIRDRATGSSPPHPVSDQTQPPRHR